MEAAAFLLGGARTRARVLPICLLGAFLAGEVHAGDVMEPPVRLPALENGDMNGDWALDVTDPIYLMRYLFLGGPAPAPVFCGTDLTGTENDANGDGTLDLTDGIYLLDHLFSGGPAPAALCGSGASVQRIPTRTVESFLPDDMPPERAWIADGISHVRNDPVPGILTGDFEGDILNINNNNVNIETGNGELWGVNTFEGSLMGLSGTTEFSYRGAVEGGLVTSGRAVGRGTSGDFVGFLFFSTFEQDPATGNIIITGYAFTPGN